MHMTKNVKSCMDFLRRKRYTATISFVLILLVASQLKLLFTFSKSNPRGNVYFDISNNTTFDIHTTERSERGVYVIVGSVGLNVRTQSCKKSLLVTTLPQGSVVVTRLATSPSSPLPERIQVVFPTKGWISSSTYRTHLVPAHALLPSCRLDSYLYGVEYAPSPPAISKTPSRLGKGGTQPPAALISVRVNNSAECCYLCASSPSCTGWTYIHGMCRERRAGMDYKRTMGLSDDIVSGSMEYSFPRSSVSATTAAGANTGADGSVNGGIGAINYGSGHHDLAMDPHHYLRRGAPFHADVPLLPSSWMEQWPIGNGRLGALAGGYSHEVVIPVSVAGLHVVTGDSGADAVLTAKRDHILSQEGSMSRNYFPYNCNSSASFSCASYDTKNVPFTSRLNGEHALHQHFRASRQALQDGDTGMSQILLSKAIDDRSYGQTQYSFDMVFVFSTTPAMFNTGGADKRKGERGSSSREGKSVGGRHSLLLRLKKLLGFQATPSRPPLHAVHARSFFNSVTGIATSSFLDRVQSAWKASSREWFASLADDVLVGHFQCSAVSARQHLLYKFPKTNAPWAIDSMSPELANTNSSKGCLHMAFKIEREMSQLEGEYLLEKYMRLVHWPNRRSYSIVSEKRAGTSEKGSDSLNMMAFSMSHAPTCRHSMHRFVESCGVVICDQAIEWGEDNDGLKAVLCNNARDAVVISTSVVGNYPQDPKGCTVTSEPYDDKDHLTKLRDQCWDIIDNSLATAHATGNIDSVVVSTNVSAVLKRRHIALQSPVMQASDIFFGGAQEGDDTETYARSGAVEYEAPFPPAPPPIPPMSAKKLLKPSRLRSSSLSTLTDLRCTLKEPYYHDPSLVSFKQECVQSASSVVVGHNEFKLVDNVAVEEGREGSDSHPLASGEVHYTLQQKHSLRSILTSTYARSKYLMYSSGARQVSLLQGLWVDGPFSAWNGDFHLNINLQMSYWAAPALPVISSSVAPPLQEFIQQLAAAGEVTAQRLYNCSGWVAHGYVDNLLNTGIRGGLMWNMCVTCGAWLALHLWDQLSHSYDSTLLVHVLLPVYRNMARFFLEYMFEGPDGHTHTGPSASPENSYVLHNQDERGGLFKTRHVRVITHSPNIDIAILRQVGSEAIKNYLESPDAYLDQRLSRLLRQAIIKMPNGAIPTTSTCSTTKTPENIDRKAESIDPPSEPFLSSLKKKYFPSSKQSTFNWKGVHTVIDEYPASPLASNYTNVMNYPYITRPNSDRFINPKTPKAENDASKEAMPIFTTSEELDRSHRHFSGLLWLYPGTFLPSALPLSKEMQEQKKDDNLYSAAHNLLQAKILEGGGHTSWSSAWEACLMARMRDARGLEMALQKLLSRYFTPSLLSVHPAITAVPPSPHRDNSGCESCYKDFHNVISDDWKKSVANQRGMATSAGGQYQFDGNAGVMAAVHEMLMQSHVPLVIALLPAITTALRDNGMVRRLIARGGVEVSFMWAQGQVTSAIIEIPAWHPLLRPMTEERRGFFQPQQTLPSLSIVIPNTMTVMRLLLGGKEEARGGDGRFQVLPSLEDVHTSFQRRPGDVLHSLRLPRPQDRTSYPLKLYICKREGNNHGHGNDHPCREELKYLDGPANTQPGYSPGEE